MHRPRSAAVLVALLPLVLTPPSPADAPQAPDQARALLARGDARGAIAVLEDALPIEPARRGEVLELLRRAYATAARQAEAAGRPGDAETFRDNLEILDRKPRPRPEAPRPSADPAVSRASVPLPDTTAAAVPAPPTEVPLAAEPPVRLASIPAPAAPEPAPEAPQVSVATADAAFVAKRYDEAGRLYAELERQARLPKSRRDHWAYCRWVEVVRRINANPSTAEEWAAIDAEIARIRELSPNNWYGEYLRNRAAERTPGRAARPSQKVIVRSAAPEEAAPPAGPAAVAAPKGARPRTEASPKAEPPRAPAARAGSPPPSGTTAAGGWQVRETANFRIFHADPALAERVAEVAESAREFQAKRWMGPAGRAWNPRCDIYVYPNVKVFSRMTGQPEESPGFSTMGLNAGKIIARRVNVRADHPNLLAAILPHEITHVVLADLFPHQQIPRWADEGMAVLSEPPTEQRLRANDLEKPLANGQVFKVDDLMVMDYPDGRFWGLYYAQSVSLTRFLVEQGTPAQFIQFVQGSQRNGHEAELRRVYKIDGFGDLQKRWLAYAKANTSEATAAANPAGDASAVGR